MKISLLSALLMCAIAIKSQTERGSMLLGGGVNYYQMDNSQSNEYSNVNSWKYINSTTSINFGYFVTDGLVAGVEYLFGYYRQESESKGIGKQSQMNTYTEHAPGIFGRYYKMTPGKFGFFLHLSGNYILRNGRDVTTYDPKIIPDPPSRDYKATGFRANLGPGVVYFLNEKVGLEARLGGINYSSVYSEAFVSGKKINHSQENSFSVNFGISTFMIGASFYFGESKKNTPETQK
jgi:hypothetical protein